MLILAIESSCDENSAAVIVDGRLLAVETRTQTVHQPYGGVVPELAGRSHLELVDEVVQSALKTAQIQARDVDAIAATAGPGLIGSLLVGLNYARGLSNALSRPFYAIHHVEAHLWSAELSEGLLPLPFLVLLVSGGHSQLIRVDRLRCYHIIGSTLDDALGEAYDKVGKLLGLSFPCGAEVDRLAQRGDACRYRFPTAMNDSSTNLSFSGLKTAVAYKIRDIGIEEAVTYKCDLFASFQDAALTAVLLKTKAAVQTVMPKAIVAAGGVAANSELRARLKAFADKQCIPCFLPSIQFCGDNAAMIGYLAWKLLVNDEITTLRPLAKPRWPLEQLMSETTSE